MLITLLVGEEVLNVISAYTPLVGLGEHAKRHFWDQIDVLMQEIHWGQKIIVGGDFNGHVGKDRTG